jgi:hypothetical protein
LANVAKADKDAGICMAALVRVTDQNSLAVIAASAIAADVRTAAMKRVTDQSVLAIIATAHNDWRVRKAAVECLSDRNVHALQGSCRPQPSATPLACPGRATHIPLISVAVTMTATNEINALSDHGCTGIMAM